jgi:hypothetical protein
MQPGALKSYELRPYKAINALNESTVYDKKKTFIGGGDNRGRTTKKFYSLHISGFSERKSTLEGRFYNIELGEYSLSFIQNPDFQYKSLQYRKIIGIRRG